MLMGYLSDHFNAWLLALSSLVATALATFVLWGVLGNTFAGLIAFGIAYGIVAGRLGHGWNPGCHQVHPHPTRTGFEPANTGQGVYGFSGSGS